MRIFKKFILIGYVTAFLPFAFTSVPVSAQDCDANAIIRCGVTSQANLQQKYAENQAGNVQQIFREFDINDANALNGLVSGQVTRDNRVLVNGQLVATNAFTAGRQRLSPSDVPIAGGAAYKRHPSVSFRSSSLSALVKMDGNRFVFAVIMSCGNPVVATPTAPPTPTPPQVVKTPNFDVTKQVRVAGESAWMDEATAKPGDQVQFRILVSNTGEVDFTNIILRDTLPVGFTNTGSITGTAQQLNGNLFGQDGLNIGALAAGQQREIIFTAAIGAGVEACSVPARNVVKVKPDNLPEEEADATVKICKPAQPVVTQVVVQTPPPQPTPPPAPARVILPVTGPTGLLGIFIGTSVAGTLAHRYLLGRKFNG